MDYVKIGQRIRKYRKEKGLSQEQLAEKIWISTTHMSHIETGSTKLSLPVLVDISKVLDVSTDELLFDRTEQSVNSEKINKLLSSCSPKNQKLIEDIVVGIKNAIDNNFDL